MSERRRARNREVIAFGEVSLRRLVRGKAVDALRQLLRAETRAIDENRAVERLAVRVRSAHLELARASPDARHTSLERDLRAGGFRVSLKGQHQRVAVDDPSRRRP